MKKRVLIIAAVAAISAMLLTGCVDRPATSTAAEVVSAQQTDYRVVVSTENDLRNSISITATGEVKLMPDVAYATVGVLSKNEKLKTAQEDNRTKMDAIYKALNDKGITKENIRTASYSVNPTYDYTSGTGKITGYEVANTVEVTINNIESVGEILDVCSAAGANTAYPIQFDLKDKTAAYNDALKQAVEKAKAKADIAAKASNVTISGVMKIEENYNTSTPYFNDRLYATASATKESVPETQISAGELTITADVHIVYEIK